MTPTEMLEFDYAPQVTRRLSESAAASMSRRVVPPGSVAVSCIASIGKIARIREWTVTNQQINTVVPLEGTLDGLFAFYGMRFVAPRLHQVASGSVTKIVNKGVFSGLRLPLPSLAEQQQIAGVLGAVDDLIDANQRLIRSLDELFHAEWTSRFRGLQSGGTIPLAQICTTQYGFTDAATTDSMGPKFVRVADINKHNWIEWDSVPYCSSEARRDQKYTLHKGDLLVARMADPGKVARVDDEVDAVFASYLVRVKPVDPSRSLFLYGFLKSEVYQAYARAAMTGSVQKNMNAKVIAAAGVGLPTRDSLSAFDEIAAPIRDQIAALVRENSELRKVRDQLLPLLMSGRVRVQEVAA